MKKMIFSKLTQNFFCGLLIGSLVLCLFTAESIACDPNTLSVDFGLTGQTTDSCWDSWHISGATVLDASDPNHLISISSPLGQSGSVGVKVEWTGGGSGVAIRNRPVLDVGHSQYNLLLDHVYNDNGSFAVRLYDLRPGTYFITTYHADPGNKRNPIDITINDGAGDITPIDAEGSGACDAERVISGVQQSLGTTASDGVSSITFAFIVSGKEQDGVFIGFDDAGGPDLAGPVLNGFTIVRPEQDLIQVDLGREFPPNYFESYEQMNAPADGNDFHLASISVSSFHGVSGSVDLSLSAVGMAWRGGGEQQFIPSGYPYRDLLNDLSYSLLEMTLTIDDLKEGTYQISSFHNDPDSSQRNVNVYVDGNQVVDEAGQSSAINTKVDCYSKVLVPFTVENDGDTVIVNYQIGEYGGGGSYIILNGFEIDVWQIPDQIVCGHPSVPPLSGDYNGDCSVDIDDVGVLGIQWLGSTLP